MEGAPVSVGGDGRETRGERGRKGGEPRQNNINPRRNRKLRPSNTESQENKTSNRRLIKITGGVRQQQRS